MGLSCSQARLLTLTARKADCEYGLSIDSMHKMSLTREMSELSQEYYSKLQAKNIAYYANGRYNKMDYQYLMGRGVNYTAILNPDKYTLKKENSMVLSDYKGQIIMNEDYANAITAVLGSSAMNAKGQGGTFSVNKIPEIIAAMTGFPVKADVIKDVMNGGKVPSEYASSIIKTLTQEDTGKNTVTDNTDKATELINKILDFYVPIFTAAATNGWTTEYNKDMSLNEDYVSDALVTGSFQLATVNEAGEYDEGGSLTYFITAGLVESRTDSEIREEITAWYNAEKDRISEKETMLDLHMDELSTELEAINTEIQSIQSLVDDAISVFEWGT